MPTAYRGLPAVVQRLQRDGQGMKTYQFWGSARRSRVEFGRWPNVPLGVSGNLVDERIHVDLHFQL
jgi:hypothetical protein